MATEMRNRVAVLALTRGGARLARVLSERHGGAQLFLPIRLRDREFPAATIYFEDWSQVVSKAFNCYTQLVFIMATGIVVRSLAPLLKDKKSDPAVVVLDEKGQFCISLLSGHLGGANELARELAGLLNGTAVITTATDVNGALAVEVLAKDLECQVYPPQRVRLFNRLLAEGEKVGLVSQWPVKEEYKAGFSILSDLNTGVDWPVVYISNKIIRPVNKSRLVLRPRNLIAGVGCRREVCRAQVVAAIKNSFRLAGYSLLSLRCLATVDIKMQEPGLIQAAEYFRVPLIEVTKQEIEGLAGQFTPSAFVRQAIGVGGVCEPAAIMASGRGRLLLPKQKQGPVTVAIAEARLWWWD